MENIEPTKLNYPITIDYKVFADFMLNTKSDVQRAKSLNIIGNWISEMEKKVVSHENEPIKLQQLKGRINSEPKRSGSSYFAGNAKCKICKCTYAFSIAEKPLNQAPFIVNIQVTRTHEHEHQGKQASKQIRGEARKLTAERVLLERNGCAAAFLDNERANNIKSSQIESNNLLPTVEVIRKIVSEQLNNEIVSTSWITNVQHASDMAVKTLKGKKLNGYVQSFEVIFHNIFNLFFD